MKLRMEMDAWGGIDVGQRIDLEFELLASEALQSRLFVIKSFNYG